MGKSNQNIEWKCDLVKPHTSAKAKGPGAETKSTSGGLNVTTWHGLVSALRSRVPSGNTLQNKSWLTPISRLESWASHLWSFSNSSLQFSSCVSSSCSLALLQELTCLCSLRILCKPFSNLHSRVGSISELQLGTTDSLGSDGCGTSVAEASDIPKEAYPCLHASRPFSPSDLK